MQRNGNRKQTRAVQIAALAAAALVAGIGLSRHHAEARQQSYETFELATTIGDGFTIASVGDLIMAFPASKLSDPARQAAFDLVRSADVGFANMESTILDAATWDGDFAGPFVGTPDVAEDVKDLGFDLVARSNNHSGEYGIEGLLDTSERLARAGVVSAGSGESYWAARAPRFVTTDKGRVGLVATASSFSASVVANPGRGEWTGRGGASALRTTRWWVVPPSMWNAVTTIREAFPTGGSLYAPLGETDDEITILGRRFRKADVDGPHWSYDIDERDLNDVLAMVREGKLKSDFLAVAIHSHETHGADGVWPEIDPLPGDFLPRFAKATIDNGADAFFGSGVHVLRGIEIYKDRPISTVSASSSARWTSSARPRGAAAARAERSGETATAIHSSTRASSRSASSPEAGCPRFASTRPISDMTSGWRTGVCRDSPRRRSRGAC